MRGWAVIVRHVGLNERSAAPTLVGFLFGLAYGGGVIVRDIRRHDLARRQVFIMSVFLSMVHAIVEDSLVFLALIPFSLMALFWIVVYRIAWAALVTLALTAVARRPRAPPRAARGRSAALTGRGPRFLFLTGIIGNDRAGS